MVNKTVILCLLASLFSGYAIAENDSTSTGSSAENQSLAAAWCEKRGGKVYAIKPSAAKAGKAVTKNTKCLLPSGELVDIWALYKRDRS